MTALHFAALIDIDDEVHEPPHFLDKSASSLGLFQLMVFARSSMPTHNRLVNSVCVVSRLICLRSDLISEAIDCSSQVPVSLRIGILGNFSISR